VITSNISGESLLRYNLAKLRPFPAMGTGLCENWGKSDAKKCEMTPLTSQ